MSKTLKKFWNNWAPTEKLMDKLVGRSLTPGARILPVNKGDDANAELRIDAGEKVGDKQNVVLQVNSQAQSGSLKTFVTKNGHGTHAKLASGTFDTKAADAKAEIARLVKDLDTQARSRLG